MEDYQDYSYMMQLLEPNYQNQLLLQQPPPQTVVTGDGGGGFAGSSSDHQVEPNYQNQLLLLQQQPQTVVTGDDSGGGAVGFAGSSSVHQEVAIVNVAPPLPLPPPPVPDNYHPVAQNNYDYDPNDYPPGYRFCPDDDELVSEYLLKHLCKIGSEQGKRRHDIPELDIYQHSPDQITRKYPLTSVNNEYEWFFFTPVTKRYPNGNRPRRECADGSGYWKPTGKDANIKFQGDYIATKKCLDFFSRNSGKKIDWKKTDWKMHEYKLIIAKPKDESSSSKKGHKTEELLPVLCRIYVNTRKKNKENLDGEEEQPAEVINSAGIEEEQQEVPPNANTVSSVSDDETVFQASQYPLIHPNETFDGSVNNQGLQNHPSSGFGFGSGSVYNTGNWSTQYR